MAAKGQGGFESDAGSKAGVEIWRIENLNPVKQDASVLSEGLYDGDCYIFLNTKEKSSGLEWDLYFWLGENSSQDEQGGAALRTVELDDQLGGGPIQFREVMGHESGKFLKLFPGNTLATKAGGVASAFNKVERDSYKTRLFHLKGKREVRVKEVELKTSSMNEGDVFVLDAGLKLYQWNGKDANKYEKAKGLDFLNRINNNERGARAECFFLDSGSDNADFWGALEGSASDVLPASAAGDDQEHKANEPTLVKISDEGGSLKQDVVATGALEHSMLDGNDAFIVDVVSEIFVWVGAGASKDEKRNGMKFGMDYVKAKGLVSHCNIQKFNEGKESTQFKGYFRGWPEKVTSKSNADDVSALYKAREKKEEQMANMDGKVVKVWRINNMAKEEVAEKEWGQFYAGDSFIILYTYKTPGSNKDQHIIYFWQGRDSSNDEKGASALLAKELDDEMGGDPVQVRVVMGKEPSHFLSMFGKPLITHFGGVASGFKNRADTDSFDTDGISLYHVKGNNKYNTRAVQVEEVAGSLNSGDCFVLLTEATMFIWRGNASNDEEKECAKTISSIMQGNRSEEIVDEGSEPDAFWDGVGGKGEYTTEKDLGGIEHEPRLFQMSCNTSSFVVNEIPDFDQSDLIPNDVMMLDTYNEVFLWIGPEATKTEQDESMKSALKYVQNAPDGRDPDTPVYSLRAGCEPPQFTSHFLGWSAANAVSTNAWTAPASSGGAAAAPAALTRVSEDTIGFAKFPQDGGNAYELDVLVKTFPDGLDPKQKELYLSDASFEAVFGMNKEAWGKLAQWKKTAAKKKHKLF